MTLAIFALVLGLVLLVWSSDRFVDGAAAVSQHAGMSPLLIGIVVMGFGTSAPELMVSALAALEGKPSLALGNAYGSNITNISLILGLTSMLNPISVHSQVLRREMPILIFVTLTLGLYLRDGLFSRWDAAIHLLFFAGLMGWSVWEAQRNKKGPQDESADSLGPEVVAEMSSHPMSLKAGVLWTITGLILLVLSSQILVWGAINIATALGISELVIGLTIVAVGTSLPELASSVMAARKGEHDLALGNILGSNLFNTLAVVGVAGIIKPIPVPAEVLTRDWPAASFLTVSLYLMCQGFFGPGKINRFEGALLFLSYFIYLGVLIYGL